MSVSLDHASPTSARYVHLAINLHDGAVSRDMALGIRLLNPAAPW
jgi:hypothetical protein